MGKSFTKDWKDWINLNVKRGCDKDDLFKILIDKGFDPVDIQKQMNYTPIGDIGSIFNPPENPEIPVQSSSKSIVTEWLKKKNEKFFRNRFFSNSETSKIYLPNAKKLDSKLAEVYIVSNFLNDEECSQVIRVIKSKLRPSTITNKDDPDKTFRTSRSCDLGIMNENIIGDIDRKICNTIGIDASYSEAMQGQHYEIGEEFKAHTDYFEGDADEEYVRDQGQRTYTFMVYLNDVDSGGETEFKILERKIKPRKGMALIWNNLNKDGSVNPNTIHQGHRVHLGQKLIITKWFRSRGQGPMFIKKPNKIEENTQNI